jgi:hypothetical protein
MQSPNNFHTDPKFPFLLLHTKHVTFSLVLWFIPQELSCDSDGIYNRQLMSFMKKQEQL